MSVRHGQAVFVAGEGGLGKRRWFATSATGYRRRGCSGAGVPLGDPAAAGPVCGRHRELNGAAADLASRGARPYEVARRLLDDLARQPAVVVLADLDWPDDGSLDELPTWRGGCSSRRCSSHLS